MGSAAPVEGLPGRRVALPQRVVGLAVQTADRLPLVEDRAQPVAGGFPLRRVGGQILGLGGQRLLAGGLGGPMLVAPGAVGGRGRFGALGNAGKPGGQRVDVAEHVARRQRFGQAGGGGFDLACIAGTGRQPLFHQRDLGAQVIESPAEMGERGFGVAGLPGPDDPLAGRADQPYRSVVVDASESVRIVGQRSGDRVRVGTGSRSGPGARSRTRDRPGFVVWLVRRHELTSPTLRAVIGRAPAARCGAVNCTCGRSRRGTPVWTSPVLKQLVGRCVPSWRCSCGAPAASGSRRQPQLPLVVETIHGSHEDRCWCLERRTPHTP